MQRGIRAARWITVGGLAATATGLAVLFLCSLREVLADPSMSLEDGYWIGRLPWTAVGVDLVVIGATVTVVAGTVSACIAGGWIRRSVTALAAGVAGFWWLVTAITSPGESGCVGCTAPGFDPFTIAYSLPQETLLLLVAPAAVIGLAALTTWRSYSPAATPSNQMKTT